MDLSRDEVLEELMETIRFLSALGVPKQELHRILRLKLRRLASRAEAELPRTVVFAVPSLN